MPGVCICMRPRGYILWMRKLIKYKYTDIYSFNKPPKKYLKQLRQDLDNLVKLSHRWQLGFNEAKCSILNLGSSNQRLKYQMETEILGDTRIVKDVGIFIDEELKFHAHVSKAV